MKKYKWNSIALKKKNGVYTWLSFLAMILALLSTIVLPRYEGNEALPFWVALGFMVIAIYCFFASWKAQVDDRKVKK